MTIGVILFGSGRLICSEKLLCFCGADRLKLVAGRYKSGYCCVTGAGGPKSMKSIERNFSAGCGAFTVIELNMSTYGGKSVRLGVILKFSAGEAGRSVGI